MIDCVGNEIHEGAILKVYHFIGARKRKHWMYKQVGGIVNGYREIFHLPFGKGSYYKKDDITLTDSVVVSCRCEFHIHNDLKISKFHGS